jgi:threonine dehydratase
MITRDDIQSAYRRLAGHIRHTPCISPGPGAFSVPGRLTLKLELLQHTGSFKARGAFNRMLTGRVPSAGVIAASGGNHGAAVAFAARALGHAAEIFVPTVSSPVKVERLHSFGAMVNQIGSNYKEALAASEQRAQQTGAMQVHAYDQDEVLAGQGTVGLELEQDAPGLDTLLVATGGGGLIGGIAAWYAGSVKVVSVEPATCPSLHAALAAGEPVDVPVSGYAIDSLGASRVGAKMFEIAQQYVAGSVLVSDDDIRDAQRALWRELRIVTEPGGATALAALLAGAYRAGPSERVGVLICGGNVGLDVFAQTLC